MHRGLPRALLLVITLTTTCREQTDYYRGAGLEIASLQTDDATGVYRAALAGSFTLGDPSLSILLDTTFLPRTDGLASGEPVPAELRSALRADRLVQGTCTIPIQKSREPLICPAARAGYAVRFSRPFARARDTVQVHIVVEQYAIPDGPRAERLRFERAYYVARQGRAWRATREARLPQP